MSEYPVWKLARLADCGDPDSDESAGAKFLSYIQDNVNEAREYSDDGSIDRDRLSEIADGAPDVYTHRLWAEYVDLSAYREDPTELGFDGEDMEQGARLCLYMIAERLANVLAEENADEEVDA